MSDPNNTKRVYDVNGDDITEGARLIEEMKILTNKIVKLTGSKEPKDISERYELLKKLNNLEEKFSNFDAWLEQRFPTQK